jgi:putative ABC transport system permease protein
MRNGLLGLTWRFAKARPLRTLLAALSVALGTGLLAALLTLNTTMDRALAAQIARDYGTYDVLAGYRTPSTRLSEADVAEIAGMAGVADAAGVLIPYMYEYHDGLDPRLQYYGAPDTPLGHQLMPLAEGRFPGPGEVAVTPTWARQQGLAIGDTWQAPFAGRPAQPVRISGLLKTPLKASMAYAVFEAGWLQAATGRPGATFVMIQTQPGTPKLLLIDELQERFAGLEGDQRKFLDEMRTNLNALRPVALGMGLACLLAAAFLLTSSFRMALTERTRELAILRAVAATPGQVRGLILAEGLLLGLSGSAAGVLGGAFAASLLGGAAARLLAVESVPAVIPWVQLAVTGAAGTVLTVLSARQAAGLAADTPPVRALRPDLPTQEDGARSGGRAGLLLVALGALLLGVIPWLPVGLGAPLGGGLSALLGGTGGLSVALGLLLAAQRLLPLLLGILARPFQQTAEGQVAVRSLLRHRRGSGLTMGAVGLGMVLVVAISTLGSSLVGNWYADVAEQHPADVQVEVPGMVRRGLAPEIVAEAGALPGVTTVAAVRDDGIALLMDWDWSRADRSWLADMEKGDREAPLRWASRRHVLYPAPADLPALVALGAYRLVDGDLSRFTGNAIALKATTARERGIRVGDSLRLNVQQHPLAVETSPVAAEYRVAALVETDVWRMPNVIMPQPLPGAPDRVRILYVDAAAGQADAVRESVRQLAGQLAYATAEVSDAETALATLQGQVGQRLALLGAVGLIMAAVAAMSLAGAMAGSIAERRREFALLRAAGATPGQVRRMVLLEGGLLGLAGTLTGIAGGAVLGAGALFGLEPTRWMIIRLPWAVMAGGLVVGLVLALLAAVGPARRVARVAPAEAVRME